MGSEFTITTEEVLGTAALACTGYSKFARDVQEGDRILLADGAIELRALATDGISVRTEVICGGPLGDNKGINLPGRAGEHPLDDREGPGGFAFRPECRCRYGGALLRAQCRRRAPTAIAWASARIPIIAKIEKPEAWDNIEPILESTDGVMVARGDLGVEMALEKVPPIQKAIIPRARRKGRFVITATQMLESMIENSHAHPRRSERRGQRHLRRHRRGDALRRNLSREFPVEPTVL